MKNSFKILVPFYNAEKYIERCLNSLVTQKYDGDWKIIVTNDCSTDSSEEQIKGILTEYKDRIIYIKNEVRKTALENLHDMIMNYCEDDEVCSILDGDDWLINRNVISYLNDFYNDPKNEDPWIVYGQFQLSTGQKGFASAYSREEFKNIRKAHFRVSHLRSFRCGLYKKIEEQDCGFNCMKDNNGYFYKLSYDVAMFFPMLELAGFDKVKFNPKSLYIYNFENPISEHIIDQKGQTNTHIEISNKPKFTQIYNYI